MFYLHGQLRRQPLQHFRRRGKHWFQFNLSSDPQRPAIKYYSWSELIRFDARNRHEIVQYLYTTSQVYKRDLDRTAALAEVLSTRAPERQASRDLYVTKLFDEIQLAVAA